MADDHSPRPADTASDKSATGVPSAGEMEGSAFSTTGGPMLQHWQESTISEPGLDARGNVFFAAIQMTRMPMILTDPNLPDNPIAFCNKAFLDLTGYEESEVVGRNCRFLQGARTSRESVAEIRDAVAEQHAISLDILNYKRDGTPFWNGVFIGPVFDAAGKLLYFFASQLDITRRRTSEESFRQAQKMEAIGQLTAGLAHDFNNLLQVVSGNLEAIRDRGVEERSVRNLESASRAAERGSKLTKQLLAFARKTRLEARPVDLSALLNDFDEMISSTLGTTNGIDLQLSLRKRLPACTVDPTHLEVALLNVLVNARDAMPKGGVVTIATGTLTLDEQEAKRRQVAPGDYVTLSVTDEGSGMPLHVRERAIEPFFTTKGEGKGTGLGLAMVHGFAQQSHGRLEIDSELSVGTTVRLLLPVASEQAQNPARPSAPVASNATLSGETRTILAVDDSEDVLSLASDYLSTLGYTVLTAGNADEALKVLDREGDCIDLLFSDIIMPGGMNGVGLAEEVARRYPDLPVLLTTGYNEDMVADGPDRPSMDVLGKPYRRAELADRVNSALNAARQPRRTPSPFGAVEA
jgi:PAS domain S-box-containing protein